MSTRIGEITGTYHKSINTSSEVERDKASISINRFYNGSQLGTNAQITISQDGRNGNISYIHLTIQQCNQLALMLLDTFKKPDSIG